MKNINLRKSLVALSTSALIAALAVAIPSTASATGPTCSTAAAAKYGASNTQLCTGVDLFGAKYEIAMPKKFNGTLIVYSHGIRYNVNLPPLPVIAPKGSVIDDSPAIAPSAEVATHC